MLKVFKILILLANVLVLKCQNQPVDKDESLNQENPSYSFSYGVSDARTGDIKTVWESKKGDTVTGHYSILEPDGSLRTVEYSAGPKTGFTAVVKNDDAKNINDKPGGSLIEKKSHKGYENFYDFSEDVDEESYLPMKRKRTKYPSHETSRPEYPRRKKPKYPYDLDAADYTHSITIEHPSDDTYKSESHSHTNYDVDHKPKQYGNKNLFTNVVEVDYDKKNHFILPFTNSKYTDEYESVTEVPSYNVDRLVNPYEDYHQTREYTDIYRQDLVNPKKQPPIFLSLPDMPEKFYDNEYIPPRPRKRHRPRKKPEYHPANEELEDYIMVPKKKYKTPSKNAYVDQYLSEDEDYDRPQYSGYNDEDELRPHRPSREPPTKEIIKKVVKKKNPVLKLFDIFDI